MFVPKSTGGWTPTITFTTAGDLSVVYVLQATTYERHGNVITCALDLQTSTFTHTTASGNFHLSGLPFTVGAVSWYGSSAFMSGWTASGLLLLHFRPRAATTHAELVFGTSGGLGTFNTAHVLTGTTIRLRGTFVYLI